jgi:transposase
VADDRGQLARREEAMNEATEFDAYVGIDWASDKHDVCVLDARGGKVGEKAFEHSGAGLGAMCEWLAAVTSAPPMRVAVAIELVRGAVIATLLERGYDVWSCNPKQLDRLRDRFTMAGAKDDRLDAFVLADAARRDRDLLRRVPREAPSVIRLRELARLHTELTADRVRLENRLHEQLNRYFPQMLKLGPAPGDPWMLDLWERAPAPDQAASLKRSAVAAVLRTHRIRRISAEEVLAILREPKLHVASGAAEAAILHIGTLVPRLRVVGDQLRKVDRQLDAAIETVGTDLGDGDASGQQSEQRDVTILKSLPGAGRIVIATLLAEAWQVLRARDYQQLRSICGVAPVTLQSGKKRRDGRPNAVVLIRRSVNHDLRNALWYWAGGAVLHDARWRAAAAALRARGLGNATVRRVIGDRLLRITCACLRDGTLYDEQRHAAKAA